MSGQLKAATSSKLLIDAEETAQRQQKSNFFS
jgi:hypothetical protein